MTSVSGDAKQRASDRIARLAGQGLDLVGFWRASTEVLASAVPHGGAPCWFTLDPASLLVTSHFDEGVPELPPNGRSTSTTRTTSTSSPTSPAPSAASRRCTRPPAATPP